MLLRDQFSSFIKVGISLLPQQISGKMNKINRLFYALLNSPELFNNFIPKIKKAIKRIITGRSDLVIEGIRQHLYNQSVEEAILVEANILIEDIIILTTKHTRYIGHLLQKSLAEIGCESSLAEEFSKDKDIGQIHFVVCPQMFSKLPKHFVAFQLEQSVSSRWFTPKYFSNLNQAYCIFEYSVKNIEFLLENDISYNKIFYLPIGSFREYGTYLKSINYQMDCTDEPIEILFYGDPTCPRRKIYLEKLSSQFNVYVASEVFGEELISLICRAKVVVNIHYYEGALLETTRIYETLSLGTPIVSESSIDIDSHTDLTGIVSFIPIGDIDAMITELHLLLTEDLQQQRRLAISHFLGKDCKFSDYFKRFLLSNDLFDYNFDDYLKDVNFIETCQEIPRLCLSLTETPLRKYGFLSKPTHGFEIVEGIRYSDGWIGCAMSYKYILNKVNQSANKYALICEDDVVFPDNFEEKISDVLAYLQQTKQQWYMFSGLIADIHPETNILAVEEYRGVEYIYINRMTSTVMNIYSPEIMEIIQLWDQTNKDANTNTIDRYIESQVDLVVVTTLPYLVGHAEDKISTLWGFVNTQYSEMIETSQKILAEKVLEYKAKL
jgi:Glycosyltransferase family 25 (LPS biosynthesis protein)